MDMMQGIAKDTYREGKNAKKSAKNWLMMSMQILAAQSLSFRPASGITGFRSKLLIGIWLTFLS